jgi:hypothetical protein
MDTRSSCILIVAAEEKYHFDRSRHRWEDWPLNIEMGFKGVDSEGVDRIH